MTQNLNILLDVVRVATLHTDPARRPAPKAMSESEPGAEASMRSASTPATAPTVGWDFASLRRWFALVAVAR